MARTRPAGEKTPALKWKQAMMWIVTVAMTATITTAVKNALEVPRAHVELASVNIRSPEDLTLPVDIPGELDSRIRVHPYLRDLPSQSDVDDVSRLLKEASHHRRLAGRIQTHLAEIIQLLNTQSGQLSKEARRIQFLLLFQSRRQEYDVIIRHLKIFAGDADLPERYEKHPAGQEHFQVNLANSVVNLSERNAEVILAQIGKDPDVNQATRIALEVERSNRLVRLFIYYEPDILVRFFEVAQKKIRAFDTIADSIVAELESIVAAVQQHRVFVTAIITNHGQRPLAIRSIGILMLSIPGVAGLPSQLLPIRLRDEMRSNSTHIVAAGESIDIKLVSINTIRTIIERHEILAGDTWKPTSQLTGSRLLKLWEATTPELYASLRIAGTANIGTDLDLHESARLVIGVSASDSVYKALEGR